MIDPVAATTPAQRAAADVRSFRAAAAARRADAAAACPGSSARRTALRLAAAADAYADAREAVLRAL